MEPMAWTDDRLQHQFEAIDRRFDEVDRRFDEVDRRFGEVERQLEAMGRRIDRLADIFDAQRIEIQGLHLAITRGSIALSVGLVGLIAAILAGG